MNQYTELASVETSIENAKVAIELGQSLTRLRDNPDFKKLFERKFFIDESVRLVQKSGGIEALDPTVEKQIHRNMQAIAGTQNFLAKVEQDALQAAMELTDGELAREEILNEG